MVRFEKKESQGRWAIGERRKKKEGERMERRKRRQGKGETERGREGDRETQKDRDKERDREKNGDRDIRNKCISERSTCVV